jgi:hypothetical protein
MMITQVGVNRILQINYQYLLIKLLDVYEGNVTYISNDGTWANYTIPSSLPKVTDGTSTNNQYIRNGNGYYAFACEVTFESVMAYKTQSISVTTTNTLSTLYNIKCL